MSDSENIKIYLIDFLNIAYLNKEDGKPKLYNYKLVRDKLFSIDSLATILGIADPGTPRNIDQLNNYEYLKDKGEIIQVGPGEKADYYMIKYAENKPNCYIITNDGFKDYKIKKKLKQRVIPVTIINSEVIFSQKLEEKINIET